MKYFSLVFIIFFACETASELEVVLTPEFCDCKELHHDPIYNVFHQGDPRTPFTGICKDFYRGGFLKKECPIKDGKYHGDYKIYYKSGALKSSTGYERGLVTGHQKLFSETGELLYHGIYKHNKLVENIYPVTLKDSIKN